MPQVEVLYFSRKEADGTSRDLAGDKVLNRKLEFDLEDIVPLRNHYMDQCCGLTG